MRKFYRLWWRQSFPDGASWRRRTLKPFSIWRQINGLYEVRDHLPRR